MQNSNGVNKNVLILTIVLFALVVALSLMFGMSKNPVPPPLALKGNMIQAVDKNIAELNSFDADLALFAEDNVVSQELDVTLSEVGEIDESSENLVNDEKNLSDLDSDLNNLSNDEKINAEIDQSLQDAAL